MRRQAQLLLWVFVSLSLTVTPGCIPLGYWNNDFPFHYVMDELGIKVGQRVADVGCEFGFFTFDLAERVGSLGLVYAVDIDQRAINYVKRRAANQKLLQIKTIKSNPKNPLLPLNTLDVVVIANAYHEMEYPDEMLISIRRSLRDGGLLAIIDSAPGWLLPDQEIAEKQVIEDAGRNGFQLERKVPSSSRTQKSTFYFLIFSPSE